MSKLCRYSTCKQYIKVAELHKTYRWKKIGISKSVVKMRKIFLDTIQKYRRNIPYIITKKL